MIVKIYNDNGKFQEDMSSSGSQAKERLVTLPNVVYNEDGMLIVRYTRTPGQTTHFQCGERLTKGLHL